MELNPNSLMAYKVTELRAELKKRGLSTAGLKQVLVSRLKDYLLQQQARNASGGQDKDDEKEEDALEASETPEARQKQPPVLAKETDVASAPPASGVSASPPVKEKDASEEAPEASETPEARQKQPPVLVKETGVASAPLVPNARATPPVEGKVAAVPVPAPQPKVAVAPNPREGKPAPAPDVEAKREEEEEEPGAKGEGEEVASATDNTVPVEDDPIAEGKGVAPDPETADVGHGELQQPIQEMAIEQTVPEPVVANSLLPPVSEPMAETALDVEMDHAPLPVSEPVSESAPDVEMDHAPPLPDPESTMPVAAPAKEQVTPESAPEAVPETELKPVSEPASEPASEPVEVESSTARLMDTAPIATPDETTTDDPSVSETLVPHDALPEAVLAQDIGVDPVDSLKRKRSLTPPQSHPTSVEPSAENDATPPSPKKQRAESSPRRGRDARFKGLFNESLPAADQEMEDNDQDEAPVEPSTHPVTRALYIRNFVRPLQENSLRSHVLGLASRNEEEPAPSLIESFYVDQIKSHALIVFDTPASANRVRVGIHNRVFPPEKTRKPLWADFVPEEKVADWVQREKARGVGGRWEVLYETVNGEVTAELAEVGMGSAGGRLAGRMGSFAGVTSAAAPARAATGSQSVGMSNAPSGPRRTSESAPGSYVPPPMHSGPSGPRGKRVKVMNLDQLFLSTRAKPKLYYLPVDKEVATERMKKYGKGEARNRH